MFLKNKAWVDLDMFSLNNLAFTSKLKLKFYIYYFNWSDHTSDSGLSTGTGTCLKKFQVHNEELQIEVVDNYS
jgi:hypothetical protein